jgi:hypothetical protein
MRTAPTDARDLRAVPSCSADARLESSGRGCAREQVRRRSCRASRQRRAAIRSIAIRSKRSPPAFRCTVTSAAWIPCRAGRGSERPRRARSRAASWR